MFIKKEIVRLIVQYVDITISIISIAFPVWFKEIPPNPWTKSAYPMAIPKDEFLVRFRYWEVRGGIITLKAWGMIINRMMKLALRPIACAASLWPLETDIIPDLTVSDINAAV